MMSSKQKKPRLPYMPPSKTDDWETPDIVYDTIKEEFAISKNTLFDPCPLNPDFDGLAIPWKKFNYVNPPYSKLAEFVKKAIHESNQGKTVFMLLPSKTDQTWFHDLWYHSHNVIYWFKGRLKFKNAKAHATQPHFLIEI